ncbi:hypothetical protein TNCV_2014831 [Trichonephila clavipes]|nr:hypothetical protein TNCV_2014831 [Trichonephila clavipes]
MNICRDEIAEGLGREGSHKDSTHGGFFRSCFPGQTRYQLAPLGDRPPYMSGMNETVLVLFCLGQAVNEMKLFLLGFAVNILELNDMWWAKIYLPWPNYNVN